MTELPSVAIVADDLTGAADALATFAVRGWRCRLVLNAQHLGPSRPGTAQALDTAGRAASLSALSPEAVFRITRHLAGADIAFLKVDSLLRGHIASDLAALSDGWRRVVLTPAFPAHGRTFSGEHARSIAAELADHGLKPVHVGVGHDLAALAREGVLVVEAETDEDLRRAVAGHGSTLWVGSAGLAAALASSGPPRPNKTLPPRDRAILTVVGSRTELARRQVQEALRGRHDLEHVEAAGAANGTGDLLVSIATGDGADDVSLARAHAHDLRKLDARFGALVLVGGDTAREVLTAFGITELAVVGELEPGTALSLDLEGRPIVTKSGSFGDDSALRRIHERLA